jgi:hypothetical protein
LVLVFHHQMKEKENSSFLPTRTICLSMNNLFITSAVNFILWKFRRLKNNSKIYFKKMTGMKVTYSVMNPNFSIYWMKTNSVMKGTNPKFFFQLWKSNREEGSILFCSKQIKQDKPNDAYCRFLATIPNSP